MPQVFTSRSGLSRRLAIGLAVSSSMVLGGTLYAFEAASAQNTERPEVPQYQVLDAFDAAGIVEVDVATAVNREAGMRLIADDLRENQNVPEGGTLLVEYYDEKDNAKNTGFALVFDDERAVLESGDSDQFGQVYDAEEAERIIEEEGGIRTVSYKDFKEENSGVWGMIKRFLL